MANLYVELITNSKIDWTIERFSYGKGSIDNDYLDNLDNGFLNKIRKILKIEKKYEYVLLLIGLWWFKFHANSVLFDSPSMTVKL
jgi:hypothetical protein